MKSRSTPADCGEKVKSRNSNNNRRHARQLSAPVLFQETAEASLKRTSTCAMNCITNWINLNLDNKVMGKTCWLLTIVINYNPLWAKWERIKILTSALRCIKNKISKYNTWILSTKQVLLGSSTKANWTSKTAESILNSLRHHSRTYPLAMLFLRAVSPRPAILWPIYRITRDLNSPKRTLQLQTWIRSCQVTLYWKRKTKTTKALKRLIWMTRNQKTRIHTSNILVRK